VTKFAEKVQKLGGKVCVHKTAVPQIGCLAICRNPGNDAFGLWETNEKAK